MAGKDGKDDANPYNGAGYSAEEMPDAPTIPEQYGTVERPSLFLKPQPRRPPMAAPREPKHPGGGRTDFEKAGLNDLVDLVDSSVPDDLISVGDALWEAARAIRKAEDELKTYFEGVDWGGEAKSAFADWGRGLRSNTLKLSEYAAAVGTQLNAAGCGLAMVKSQMPDKTTFMTVNDIPMPAQVPGNPQMPQPLLTGSGTSNTPLVNGNGANGSLTGSGSPPRLDLTGGNGGTGASRLTGSDNRTALGLRAVHPDSPEGQAVERNRQEAIQQLNKLSSYYAISRQNIQKAEEDKPVFDGLPSVRKQLPGSQGPQGTPGGPAAGGAPVGQGSPSSPGSAPGGIGAPPGAGTPSGVGGPPDGAGGIGGGGRPDITDLDPSGTVKDPLNRLDPSDPGAAAPASRVGTDIDSTNVPPTGTIDPVTPNSPPPTSNPSPPGPAPNGPGPGPVVPSGPPVGRPGPVGRGPVAPMPVTPPSTAQGRTTGPVGRPVPTGQGPAGSGSGTANRPPMTGGMPYAPMGPGGQGAAGGRGTGGGGATRASQPGGIVGGTPSSASGNQNGSSARGPMGMMPMGAMGAGAGGVGAGGAQGGSGRRIASAPGGIVGTPRSGRSGSGQGRGSREFTPGGSGLVSGAQPGERDRGREGPRRPDYLTEDDETWTNGQRGSVPPVIE